LPALSIAERWQNGALPNLRRWWRDWGQILTYDISEAALTVTFFRANHICQQSAEFARSRKTSWRKSEPSVLVQGWDRGEPDLGI
jgi:hypothetical protein